MYRWPRHGRRCGCRWRGEAVCHRRCCPVTALWRLALHSRAASPRRRMAPRWRHTRCPRALPPPRPARCWRWKRRIAGTCRSRNAVSRAGWCVMGTSARPLPNWWRMPPPARRPIRPRSVPNPQPKYRCPDKATRQPRSRASTCPARSMAAICSRAISACPTWSMPRSSTAPSAMPNWYPSTAMRPCAPNWCRWCAAMTGWWRSRRTDGARSGPWKR